MTAQAATATAPLPFNQPSNPDLTGTSGILQWWPDINVDDIGKEYYPYLRLLGYLGQFVYSPFSDNVEGFLKRQQPGSGWEKFGGHLNYKNKKTDYALPFTGNKLSNIAKAYINVIECVCFLALDCIFFLHEKRKIRDDSKLAVSAELGIDPEHISFLDAHKSTNLIINSAKDRFIMRNTLRLVGDGLFLHSLTAALIPMALRITFERPTPDSAIGYDIINKRLAEVRKFNLGMAEKPALVQDLKRAVQKTLRDHHVDTLTEQQMLANDVVFGSTAENIISKKFDMNEALYLLGRVINHPDHADQTLEELATIERAGMKNFALMKAGISPNEPRTDFAQRVKAQEAAAGAKMDFAYQA